MATAASYLGILGWDQHKIVDASGQEHGPYNAWQIIGVVVVLSLVAAWGGLRRDVWLTTAVATVVLTALWILDAVGDKPSDGLWPIGAALVLLGTAAGMSCVGLLTRTFRREPRPVH